jgi:23S rRNA pseudouridine1911/1915/1917 synthase
MDPSPPTRLTIPPEWTAGRLDRALADLLAGSHSRTSVARLIREGHVRLNGRPARPATEVVGGDEITLDLPPPVPADVPAEDLPLGIVWQDEHLVVVDKPAGMVTHPAGSRRTGTLVNALLHHVRDLSGIGGVLRPGIVHRLDVGTTGLLVVAKHDESHRRLADALRRREIKRIYEAVAWGRVEPAELVIDAPIGRHPRDRKRMGVVEGGRAARTRVRVLAASDVASHLEVRLETGRTHQIRVHLAHRGHPLVGDATYGGRRTALRRLPPGVRTAARALLERIDRPALHARRLELRHPFHGEALRFESPRPDDLAGLLEAAFGPR